MAKILAVEYPTEFAREFRPLLPGEGLGEEADQILTEYADHGFFVVLGAQESQLENYKAISEDKEVRERTPGDRARMGTKEEMERWMLFGRLLMGVYDSGEASISLERLKDVQAEESQLVANSWLRPGTDRFVQVEGIEYAAAFRNRQLGQEKARARRKDENDHFSIGIRMVKLLRIVGEKLYFADSTKTALTVSASNTRAIAAYERDGYGPLPGYVPVEYMRETQEDVGTIINGNEVYRDEETGKNMVADKHVVMVRRPGTEQ
ncbi:MAG TPA: hypothetical protein VLF40_00585 [Candidatus Saccharimonadales bacterium]|nr:hypothetical protein [Candidatus Saccharimonadales bacterium]